MPMTGILHQIKLDAQKSTPLYLQLAGKLEMNICYGLAHANELFPPERFLSRELRISRFTARRAIDVLCERGFLTRRQGSGTFINAGAPRLLSRLTGFSEETRLRGCRPGSLWLSRQMGFVTRAESREMNVAPQMLVARLKRLRTMDGAVVAIEHSILPAALVPDVHAVSQSLYDYLERRGSLPVRARQHIRAVNADAEQARLLGVAPGAAVFHTMRVGYLADGEVVELTHSFFRSECHDFIAVLQAGAPDQYNGVPAL